MLNIFKSLRGQHHRSMEERRQHPRHACLITVYYLVRNSWYRGSIQNISEGGVYVRSIQKGKVSKGEAILMIVDLRVLRDQIRGRIIRVGSDGIGVRFQKAEPQYSELIALFKRHSVV
jgi:hypothetical protein